MRAFLAAHWPVAADKAGAALWDLVVRSLGWPITDAGGPWRLATPPGVPVRALADGEGLVVGDLFRNHSSAVLPACALQDLPDIAPTELSCLLLRGYWGRYVALLRGPRNSPAMFRDPSGALDCITWSIGPVRFAASHLPEDLAAEAMPQLALDWERLAELLADAGDVGGRLALTGVESVAPGVLRHDGGMPTLWRPADFAANPILDSDVAASGLRNAVDLCVAAYAGQGRPLLTEVSGGLDSAIVAGALHQTSGAQPRTWLNYFGPEPWGDERAYARAVAEHLDVRLTEAPTSDEAFDPLDFGPAATAHRPSLCGLDPGYDRDVVARCEADGAEMMLTGQGGDVLFFQLPTLKVAVDALRTLGPRAYISSHVLTVARWRKVSVWSVLAAMSRAGRGHDPEAPGAPAFIKPINPSWRSEHPWHQGLEGLPPAKRLQARELIGCSIYFGDCRRARAVDVVHPLLSQPLIEHCLAVSAGTLTLGVRDRALARQVFADRLPAAVVSRWSKGDLTAPYGRRLAAGLAALREHLMEGRLAAEGLLDRELLDQILVPERLVWDGGYAALRYAAFLESWVRNWEDRISRLSLVASSSAAI